MERHSVAGTPEGGVLYAAEGAELTRYEIDTESATLARRESIVLPAAVQYAWQHPSRAYLYVVWSDGGAAGGPPGAASAPSGAVHGAGAFRIAASGTLTHLGTSVTLATRPIHVSVDPDGTHLLVAFNNPSSLTVYRLNRDGTIGMPVAQPETLDTGIYAHQIRTDPSGRTLFLVTRGHGPARGRPEEFGALKVFGYADGILTGEASVAPDKGRNYQPRHLDFHPSQPWVFVSLERQNALQVYAFENGMLSAEPLFAKNSLADPARTPIRQIAGTVRVHQNGTVVYQANRSAVADGKGHTIDGGGENNIAVYTIDPMTGEPTRIQNADTYGAEPRTFALDAASRLLVAGNQVATHAGTGADANIIPASLAVFRVRDDGTLDYVRKYDLDSRAGSLFWMGIAELPKP